MCVGGGGRGGQGTGKETIIYELLCLSSRSSIILSTSIQ
jgi:hypothetical protein